MYSIRAKKRPAFAKATADKLPFLQARTTHHARLAQLVRAPRLHRGGQGFESLGAHQSSLRFAWQASHIMIVESMPRAALAKLGPASKKIMEGRIHFVYILMCSDNKCYTGLTNNLRKRLGEHINGFVPSTKYRRPIKLTFFAGFSSRYIAAEFEKYLKTNSGRAFRNKHFLR